MRKHSKKVATDKVGKLTDEEADVFWDFCSEYRWAVVSLLEDNWHVLQFCYKLRCEGTFEKLKHKIPKLKKLNSRVKDVISKNRATVPYLFLCVSNGSKVTTNSDYFDSLMTQTMPIHAEWYVCVYLLVCLILKFQCFCFCMQCVCY